MATDATERESTPQDDAQAIAAAMTDHERFFMVRLIDAVLNLARKALSGGLVLASCRWLSWVGMWALVAFAAIVVLYGLIAAINVSSFAPFGLSIMAALVVMALIYSAGKFCNAGQTIIESTASETSSRAFFDCLSLLAAVLAVVSLLVGLGMSIQMGNSLPVGIGFLLGAGWAYLAAVALNPAVINAAVRPGATAGQEWLGIVSFFLKSLLRIVPIAFGVTTTVGAALFAIGIIRYLAADEFDRMTLGTEMLALAVMIILGAALPLLVYLAVIAFYLLVDLASAILRIK